MKDPYTWIATQIKSGPIKVSFYTKDGDKLAFKTLSGPQKIKILIRQKDLDLLKAHGKKIKIY